MSMTFLFDRRRSGQILHSKGSLAEPVLVSRTLLPNPTPYSPESTVVFDSIGNSYFGCHDGYFYSLDKAMQIRWRFQTGKKIYASPVLVPKLAVICFASGDGWLYTLDYEGDLVWKAPIGRRSKRIFHTLSSRYHAKRSHTLHEVNRINSALAWASPNLTKDNLIIANGYVYGLQAFNAHDGRLMWRHALGNPECHLTGTAICQKNTIFAVGQQRHAYRLDSSGKVLWHRSLPRGYNAWGNPSVNEEEDAVYFPISKREDTGCVVAYSVSGRFLWKHRFPGGIRGSVTISPQGYLLAPAYNGILRFIDPKNGALMRSLRVAEEHLWTSCSTDVDGNIFIGTIDSDDEDTGRILCLDPSGALIWSYATGKAHSVPVLDAQRRLYFGSWKGDFSVLQT